MSSHIRCRQADTHICLAGHRSLCCRILDYTLLQTMPSSEYQLQQQDGACIALKATLLSSVNYGFYLNLRQHLSVIIYTTSSRSKTEDGSLGKRGLLLVTFRLVAYRVGNVSQSSQLHKCTFHYLCSDLHSNIMCCKTLKKKKNMVRVVPSVTTDQIGYTYYLTSDCAPVFFVSALSHHRSFHFYI